MRKVILLSILLLNLLPIVKNGKFTFATMDATAQYYPPPTNGTGGYSSTGGNVFHADGSFWYNRGDGYNYLDRGDGSFNYYNYWEANALGIAILQDNCGSTTVGGGGYGDEDDDGGGGGPDDGGTDSGPDSDPHNQDQWHMDCKGRINGQAYINSCGICVEGNVPDTCNNGTERYYITIDNSPNKRYYNEEDIKLNEETLARKLVFHRENAPTNSPPDWYRDYMVTCQQSDTCSIDVSVSKVVDQRLEVDRDRKMQNKIIIQPEIKYYITLDGYPNYRYYRGDSIYVPTHATKKAKLILHYEGGAVNTTDITWKQDSVGTGCNHTDNCTFNLSRLGITTIDTDSANVKNLTSNPLVVYDVPILYFKRGDNYNGEYGFDDSTHKYNNIRTNAAYAKGYEIKFVMSNPNYFVPWMSLLHKQPAQIIKDTLANFSNWAKKDVNGYVEFKTDIDSIVINPTKQTYSSFVNNKLDLSVYAKEWSKKMDSLKKAHNYDTLIHSVYAITNMGDTIGKMNLSCSHPAIKKIFFVFVNFGAGYDSSSLNKINMINSLNNLSHNQIFRNWEIDVVNHLSDTLDLSAEYMANPQEFRDADITIGVIKNYYQIHKGINISAINNSTSQNNATKDTWLRVAFIVPKLYQDTTAVPGGQPIYTTTRGSFNLGGTTGCFYKQADLKTVNHELGHGLHNDHIWEVPFLVPEKTTDNIMDYTPLNSTRALNRFWYGQWMETY